ncbi:GNAT family N-acetyltransferase [Cytobacillus firmus]|uniref:GNAT family N-acetyltransferase n=1 Tax=Cytobacillus firmus TaxID=1399 RepID=UPI003747FE6C
MFNLGHSAKLTDRMLSIIKSAEKEARMSGCNVIHPVHLLIGCLEESSGALGEISLKCNLNPGLLRGAVQNTQRITQSEFFSIPVTDEVIDILDTAIAFMNRYNQVFVNEGHLLKALLTDSTISGRLSGEMKKTILTLGTSSRDMITHLGSYTFPQMNTPFVRKVHQGDERELADFTEKNFSKEWAHTIQGGFQKENPSIYIACDEDGRIIGFAAFDVYQNKKGYFGPMGVVKNRRVKGIGNALLHHCLKDMKEIGYEYAIIGGAGPTEFYEKACRAVVIPSI